MKLPDPIDIVEILPSRKKRLWLFLPLIGLMIVVAMTTTFKSSIFMVYIAVLLWATVNLAIRLFSSRPVLVLTPDGLQSRMTANGKKAGLVLWTEITEIRDIKTLGFIRGIEIYTQAGRPGFPLHLASDEAAISHAALLDVLMHYWKRYADADNRL